MKPCFSFARFVRAQLILARPLVVIGVAFILFLPGAWARLGENEPELVRRYGALQLREPEIVIEQGKMKTLADNLHFRKDEWTIIARLVDGRCESITFAKDDYWTDDELDRVLEANRGKSRWKELKSSTPKLRRNWKRRDGGIAEWGLTQGITLETPAYAKAREALHRQAKKEAAK